MHFTEEKNPRRRKKHIHCYIYGLKIPKEVWDSSTCWPWTLPFCVGVNPARCWVPLIHSSWRHLSPCLMLSTFTSTGFLHTFCLRQTDLLTGDYVFPHLSNQKAWSFCRRFETRTADVTALLCCNKNEGYYYKYKSILTSAFMVFNFNCSIFKDVFPLLLWYRK